MPVLYVSSIVYLLLAIGISFNITKGDQKPEKPEKQRRLVCSDRPSIHYPPVSDTKHLQKGRAA